MGTGRVVETLNETVDPEAESLPEEMRARLARIEINLALARAKSAQ
jgi:hypothetical protein